MKILYAFRLCLSCVCFRGKGDYYRLGTDSNNQVSEPQLVEAMDKKVIQIAVGSLHCLALTENGEVCSGVMAWYLSPSIIT